MSDLAAWAEHLVNLADAGDSVAVVARPSRAYIAETCLDEPWDLGATAWKASVLDDGRAELWAGVTDHWTMPVDLAVVAPRGDLAPLLARTIEGRGVTLRAGLPLEAVGDGRWRWAAGGLEGSVALRSRDVGDVVLLDEAPDEALTVGVGPGVLRAEARDDAEMIATVVGCEGCARLIDRGPKPWVEVVIRHGLAEARGWMRYAEPATPKVFYCPQTYGPFEGVALGTPVAWTEEGAAVGRTTWRGVRLDLAWPAARMRFTAPTPWGPLSMYADHPEWTALDRWFSTLRSPRSGVFTSADCARWDSAPDPERAGVVWLSCASDPTRRVGLARGNGWSLGGFETVDGQPMVLGWRWLVRDHGGRTGLGQGRALTSPIKSRTAAPELVLLPIEVSTDRVTLADVVAADVPPLSSGAREIIRQDVDEVRVVSREVAPGRWVDDLEAWGRTYTPPSEGERSLRIAFVGERYVSAYVAASGAVGCVTFDRETKATVARSGAPPGAAGFLLDEATGRTLWCVPDGDAVRLVFR